MCLPLHTLLAPVSPGRKCNTGCFSRKRLAQPSLCLLGPQGVGSDVEEDGLFHGAALLRLIKGWATDEGVLVARLLWAVLTSEAGPVGREARTPPPPPAAFLAVLQPSELDLCLVGCLGM